MGTLPFVGEEGYGTKPFREEDGVGAYKYTEGVGKCRGSKPSKDTTTSIVPPCMYDQMIRVM